MSKKKNRNRQQKPPVQTHSPNPVAGGKPPTQTDEISVVEDAVLEIATEEDLKPEEAQSSAEIEMSKTEGLCRIKDTLKVVETIKKRLEKERDDAEKEKTKAREVREALKSQREAIQAQAAEFEKKSTHISELEAELEEREKTILEREIDANKGFPKRYIEELNSIQQAHEALKEDFARKFKEFEAHKDAVSEKEKEAQAKWQTEVDEREAKLENREKALRQQERKMQRDRELLDEDRADFENRLETAIAVKRGAFELELSQYQERLGNAQEACCTTDQKLQELEEVFRCFHPKSPADILSELENLKDDKRRLQLELENRLSSDSQARLQALEREKETSDAERAELHREIARKNSQVAKLHIAATDLETARRQVDAYKANIDLLQAKAIEETRKTRELVEGKKADIVFPSLTEMDSDPELQRVPETKSVSDLKQLAGFARSQMAASKDPRYYEEATVRSFIGGMAMSRLHLLHGISGTGKTSLPLAFANGIGAGVELIEVQAGWRDRDDLFGYYNSFEQKYYEYKFLQALYRAQCPAFKDRPFFIILDEMNLSHPEQYFADILSALENSEEKRLELMTAGVKLCPRGLGGNGTFIELPDNVWFVGTANQDETTKDFADKSYDRAHVMELTGQINRFQPEEPMRNDFYGLESIQKSFDQAAVKYQEDAKAAWTFLNSDDFKKPLQQYFQVGWGPRLQRQLNRYLPTVIASGGKKGEALDHIIASKILRKIQNRYNNRREHLESLKNSLEDSWERFDPDSLPEACSTLLENEILKLRGDD